MTLVDLSHTIDTKTVTYPGFPPPAISDFLSREASVARYAAGTTFHKAVKTGSLRIAQFVFRVGDQEHWRFLQGKSQQRRRLATMFVDTGSCETFGRKT